MSLFGLIDQEKERSKLNDSFKGTYSTAGEVFSTSLESARLNYNSNSELEASGFALDDYVKSDAFKIDDAGAAGLSNEEAELRTELTKLPQFGSTLKGQLLGPTLDEENQTVTNNTLRWDENKRKRSREILKELKRINPAKYGEFDLEKASIERVQTATQKAQKAAAGNNSTMGTIAGFAGSVAASAYDPVEVLGAFFGAGAAKSLLKNVAIQAGENVLIEGAKQPNVMKWQKKLGNQYGYTDVITNLAAAGVFGGAVPVGKAGLKKGASKIFKSGKKVPYDTPILDKLKDDASTAGIVEQAAEQANPDLPISLESQTKELIDGKPAPTSEVKLSEVLQEAANNPNLKNEVADALKETAAHVKDLEDKPSLVKQTDHVKNLAEVKQAIKEGRLPDEKNLKTAKEVKPARPDEIPATLKPFDETTLDSLPETGTVRFFDELSGEGYIRDAEGISRKVHFSTIHTNQAFRTLEKGDQVKFKMNDDGVPSNVAKVNESLELPTNSLDVDAAIKDRVAEMRVEIENATKGSVVTTFKEADVGGAPIVKKSGIKSTFPEWFGELGFNSKADFLKVMKRGEGVRFERLLKRAAEDIEKGYKTSFGDVPPLKDQAAVKSPAQQYASTWLPDEKLSREELLRASDAQAANAKTAEAFNQDVEYIKTSLEEVPDMTVEVDGKQIRVSDMVEKLEDDSAVLKALSNCKVS